MSIRLRAFSRYFWPNLFPVTLRTINAPGNKKWLYFCQPRLFDKEFLAALFEPGEVVLGLAAGF
jgi:hypothetical protein